jgi:hypothetical protein
MAEIARLLDQVQRGWDGDAWHGTPLRKLLLDVSAATDGGRSRPAVAR